MKKRGERGEGEGRDVGGRGEEEERKRGEEGRKKGGGGGGGGRKRGGRGEEEGRKRGGRGEEEGRKRGGRGEEEGMKIGGRGEGEGGGGYNTGVNRAQSLDKQGDALIARNSILQSTTLKYKNLTSFVKIFVSGLSRISSSCSSVTSRLAGGRGGGSIQCHTHKQHTVYCIYTQYASHEYGSKH